MKRKFEQQSRDKSKKPLTRKQARKEQRKLKKQRKNEWYTNRRKRGPFVSNHANDVSEDHSAKVTKPKTNEVKKDHIQKQSRPLSEDIRKIELKKKLKLENEMKKQRKKQLIEANFKEDIVIKKLEKQLKLNKRKSKSIPKSFAADGLDFLLEICDPKTKKTAVEAEMNMADSNKEFQEDFFLMTGETKKTDEDSDSEQSEASSEGDCSEKGSLENEEEEDEEVSGEDDDADDNFETESEDTEADGTELQKTKSKTEKQTKPSSKTDYNEPKKRKIEKRDYSSQDDNENSDGDEEDIEENQEDSSDNENEGTWEDIYGRKRRRDGTVVEEPKEQKYIPPAIRAKKENNGSQQSEKLSRLRKKMKGLLNRLAENNMHNISSQIENLYMSHSRFDMNNTITELMSESLVSDVNTPERLIMEHVLLMIILHANVGTEVGAHFLQTFVKKFDTYLKENHPVENKTLDNVIKVIVQLYNFKLYDSKLLYEILDILSQKFEEKEVECILHVLRNVGFSLRKDNPLALKDLILNLQKKAASATEKTKDNSRIKFMLDILLAIKNNNVTKIPNYDPTYSEHLKKIMKNFIRKGNYVTPLSISLEDLLKADEKGRWWIVGSAWSGTAVEEKSSLKNEDKKEVFSEKVLKIARRHRMNTDTRRNIFCIVMTAEDYLDAFGKLLKLGLKNQQEREIVNVIIYCGMHEKTYNPYYTVLMQKFCQTDRKYQMMLKCHVWDKLKALKGHSDTEISNLARLLTRLFIGKSLPISTLKTVHFSEIDKATVRFVRQILLGILQHDDQEAVVAVFEKVCLCDKLKMFRQSLQLFISHFILSNLKRDGIDSQQKKLIETRGKMVEKMLLSKRERFAF